MIYCRIVSLRHRENYKNHTKETMNQNIYVSHSNRKHQKHIQKALYHTTCTNMTQLKRCITVCASWTTQNINLGLCSHIWLSSCRHTYTASLSLCRLKFMWPTMPQVCPSLNSGHLTHDTEHQKISCIQCHQIFQPKTLFDVMYFSSVLN